MSPPFDDDEDREAILARRKRFIASALAGLAMVSSANCSTSQTCLSIALPEDAQEDVTDASDAADAPDTTPQPCLSLPIDAGPDVPDAGPQPCLTPPLDVPDVPDTGPDAPDVGPQPCLVPPLDVPHAPDTGPGDAGAEDTPPTPCLSLPIDAGPRDAPPTPCLSLPIDAGERDATPTPCLSPLPPDSGR